MVAIGILNLILFIVGLYALVSTGWQDTADQKARRLRFTACCWIAAVLIGALAKCQRG